MRSSLRIPKAELEDALGSAIVVDASLVFTPEGLLAAKRWAEQNHYNYDDVGSLLLQWALKDSLSGEPDIDEVAYTLYPIERR